mgnify:CR=1 FL=1
MKDLIGEKIKSYSSNSRLWIFQSLSLLTNHEKEIISNRLNNFFDNWDAHGKILKSSSFFVYSNFLVVLVDSSEVTATGCSIDKLFNKIKEIGEKLNKNLINNNFVAYKFNDSESINFLNLFDFKKKIRDKLILDCVVFDNSISNIEQFKKSWVINIEDWKKKYIKI